MELSFKPSSYTLNAAPVAALHSLPADWWRGGKGWYMWRTLKKEKIKIKYRGEVSKKKEEEEL